MNGVIQLVINIIKFNFVDSSTCIERLCASKGHVLNKGEPLNNVFCITAMLNAPTWSVDIGVFESKSLFISCILVACFCVIPFSLRNKLKFNYYFKHIDFITMFLMLCVRITYLDDIIALC